MFITDRVPHWSKIPAVERHLGEHPWLYWTDADAAITDYDLDLRDLCDDGYDLIVTHDELDLDSGSFLTRNNDAARKLLRFAWSQQVTGLFYEQTALTRAIAMQPELRVDVLEKRSMNSFWNEHRPGDFIIQAAGQPTDIEIALLEAFRAQTMARSGKPVTQPTPSTPTGHPPIPAPSLVPALVRPGASETPGGPS